MDTIKRKSYDTKIKYLAREGLLPENYKNQIHRSLIFKWKQEPKEKYIGYELNENVGELYEVMKTVADDKLFRRGVTALYRINKTLRDIISQNGSYVSQLKEHKEQVIRTIQTAGKVISIKKACSILKISVGTYRVWAKETYFKCNNSLLKLCSNAYPQQLTYKELKKMHQMFIDPQFMYWPIISIAHYGIKHAIVKAHPNTWYKYFRLMDIERYKIHKVKKIYPEGIRAAYPNEKWHADITEMMMANGQIAYIYLVIDNFSRYILSWRVALKICAKTRLETFHESVIRSRMKKQEDLLTELIVDGGSENNNKTVEEYINENAQLSKIVALKDILKSNSMIEYTNRTLKYEYLFTQTIQNLEHLVSVMRHAVFDYNNVRPHGSLKGLAPIEAYLGQTINLESRKNLLKSAAKARCNWNKTHNCEGCPFGCAN